MQGTDVSVKKEMMDVSAAEAAVGKSGQLAEEQEEEEEEAGPRETSKMEESCKEEKDDDEEESMLEEEQLDDIKHENGQSPKSIEQEEIIVGEGGNHNPEVESPKSERKIGFSIAQIMGFEQRPKKEEVEDEDGLVPGASEHELSPGAAETDPREKGGGVAANQMVKLWRPQPFREGAVLQPENPLMSSAAVAAAVPNSPDMNAMALLRQYSLFGSVPSHLKSSLISSYNSLLSTSSPSSSSSSMSMHSKRFPGHLEGSRSTHQSSAAELASQARSERRRAKEEEKALANMVNGKPKTYPCPDCGKIFNAHYNLTRHMPVHTGMTTKGQNHNRKKKLKKTQFIFYF